MIRPILHVTVIAINTFTLAYDQLYMELPFPTEKYKDLPLRARYAFLTFWCLFLQTVYFSLSLLNDVYGTNEASPKKKPLIRTIKDLVFSLAFPIALFVTISFWTVYFYRKDLVFPDYIERLVPFWANTVLHVTNAVFILTELLVTKVTYPSRLVGLALAMVFNNSYLYCLVQVRFYTGAWIYPLLEVLDWPAKVVLFVSSMILSLSLYFLGEKLCSVRNGKPVNEYQGIQKQKQEYNKVK